MKNVLVLLFISIAIIGSAQEEEKKAVLNTINQFFEGLNSGDSSIMSSTLHPKARLMTTFNDQSGTPRLVESEISKFLQTVGTPRDQKWQEKLWSEKLQVEDNLAMVWTDYSFFVDGQLSHCGVNAFMLAKQPEGWEIIQITDTRSKNNCQMEEMDQEELINKLLDNWHKAAATADENIFFGSMTEGAIYLGTDPSERWTKTEFEKWGGKYFERETAWDFTPKNRTVYFSEDGQTAWFEELLDTWMGVCRGSGVLQKTKEGWKLAHYNLAVTVLNEKIEAFIKMNNE